MDTANTRPDNFNQVTKERAAEDKKRNPVDALVEARELHALLLAINQRLTDPAMTHILSKRLREDISSNDLEQAIKQAQKLITFNEQRFDQVLDVDKGTKDVS